jgi:heme-degrading monooxygenase HmoA
MIHAIYRWHVQPGEEDIFVFAWSRGTQAIRTKVKLLRNHCKPSEFIAIASWDSLEDWQAFSRAEAPDAEAFEHLSAVSTLVSMEVGDEIRDLVDHDT